MVKKLLGRFNVETFVLKTKYQSEKSELEKKIPDTIERKIPTISGLADKSAVKSKKKKKKKKKKEWIKMRKLMKSERKLLIKIMINILLL